MEQVFSLADTRGATTVALGSSKEDEERKSSDCEIDIEKVLQNVSSLCHSSTHYTLISERVQTLCESLSLHGPSTVFEGQQQNKEANRAFGYYFDWPLL